MNFPKRFGMERHARQCYGCGRQLEIAQKIGRMAREMKQAKAPAHFEAAVLARIQAEKVRNRPWAFWRFWIYGWEGVSRRSVALAVSAVALACAGAVIYFQLASVGPQPEPLAEQQPASEYLPATSPGTAQVFRAIQDGEGDAPDSRVSRSAALPANSYYPLQEEWPVVYADPDDPGYVEIPVSGPGDRQWIMRLPTTIRMEYGQPSQEYFIRNVSH